MSAPELVRAKQEAERSRRRLQATVAELQQKLKPANIANNAIQGVKDKGEALAGDAVEAVRARPVATRAALGAVTLLLARRPLRSAVGWIFRRRAPKDQVTTKLDTKSDNYDITAPIAVAVQPTQGAD